MKNLNPKIIEILDERTLRFKCKICSQIWEPILKSEGRIARNGWQCPNRCKANDYKEGNNSDETKERQKANQRKTLTEKQREY